MHTGPRDISHSQELAKLASAVVPLPWLAAEKTNSSPPQPETPAPSPPTQNKEQ